MKAARLLAKAAQTTVSAKLLLDEDAGEGNLVSAAVNDIARVFRDTPRLLAKPDSIRRWRRWPLAPTCRNSAGLKLLIGRTDDVWVVRKGIAHGRTWCYH